MKWGWTIAFGDGRQAESIACGRDPGQVNSRGVLTGVLSSFGVPEEKHTAACVLVDKLDKVMGRRGVRRGGSSRLTGYACPEHPTRIYRAVILRYPLARPMVACEPNRPMLMMRECSR